MMFTSRSAMLAARPNGSMMPRHILPRSSRARKLVGSPAWAARLMRALALVASWGLGFVARAIATLLRA